MKNKLFPERTYEESKIDRFYWADSGWDYTTIPLIKPYNVQRLQGEKIWIINTHMKNQKIEKFHGVETILLSFSPVEEFNVHNVYIYGTQGADFEPEGAVFPRIWFVINTQTDNVEGFEKEEDFKAKLKKLNLPEKYLTPEDVFEQYQNDPVLPWFPKDIKKQLEEVKAKKNK